MTTKDFLKRYDNGDEFSERELRYLFWIDAFEDEDYEVIEEVDGENRRWSYMKDIYMRIQDRYFRFTADIGLTEYQENTYDFQPQEVTLTQETKTIIVNVWKDKN